MVLFIALAGAEVSPAQGDRAEEQQSSVCAGLGVHQCLLPPPHHPDPLSPQLPKVLRVALVTSLARGGHLWRGFCSNSSVCAQGVLSTSPFTPLMPSQSCRSWGQWWPVTVGDAERTAGDKGGGGAVRWRPRDRQSQPGRLGVTSQEMPMDIPASNSCLGNSESLLSSAADPKRLPSLLTALASSAGAGGSGPALVIMACLRGEAVKTEKGRDAPRL